MPNTLANVINLRDDKCVPCSGDTAIDEVGRTPSEVMNNEGMKHTRADGLEFKLWVGSLHYQFPMQYSTG